MKGRQGGMRAYALGGLLGVLAALAMLVAVALPPAARAQEATVGDGGTIDILLSASVGPATTNDVTVQVADEAGAPVTGALVSLEGAGAALTKTDGTVVLAQLAIGERFAVSVTKDGYRAFSSSFLCEGAADEVWRVTLAAEGDRPDPDDTGGSGDPFVKPGSGSGSGSGQAGGSAPWLLGTGLSATTGDGLWLAVAVVALACCAASLLLAFSWARRMRSQGGGRG